MTAQTSFTSLGETLAVPVLDQAMLDQIMDIDDGELGLTIEMFDIFKVDQPPRISNLQKALEANDMTKITEVSHLIKGSSGTMGAMRLRAVAALLESYGRGHAIESSPNDVFNSLSDSYKEAYDALENHIKSHTPQ